MANLLEEEIASESNPLLSHMIPKLSRVRQLQAVAESRRRGGVLSLAWFEYRQKHGLFPDRLEELSDVGAGGILNDPLTDAPMIYRKNDDGFQLYSAGVDGVDDGGVGDDFSEVGHDHVFWPPQNTE
jgi:hypothetical protein